MEDADLLSIDSNFKQIVKVPTRKDKILDVVVTDLESFYQEPVAIPPGPVDGQVGVPSDHQGVLVEPINNWTHKSTVSTTKVFQPLPYSRIRKFGEEITKEAWDFMTGDLSSTELVDQFEKFTEKLIDETFPKIKMKVTDKNQP